MVLDNIRSIYIYYFYHSQYQYFAGNPHSLHDGGNGGDDSPSSHDSGLGGNTSGSCLGSTTSNNEERSIIVEGVNGNPRTDSLTPPSHMNNEIDPSQNLIEDSQEIYKQIQSQRMNTSSPLSCPSSPLSSATSKIHSNVSLFNNSSVTDSSSRSMTVLNSHACQTVHTSDWPTNVSGKCSKSALNLLSNIANICIFIGYVLYIMLIYSLKVIPEIVEAGARNILEVVHKK